MVSISQINNVNINNTSIKRNTYNHNTQINKSNINNSNDLLMNFMNLLSKNNAARISFGDQIHKVTVGWPYTRPSDKRISEVFTPEGESYSSKIYDLQAEASKRITGHYPWPKIDKVNAWMVTAETQKFMQAGGLGTVANDLPNSFNKVFNNNNESMSVITPLYTNSNGMGITKIDGKLKYQYKKGKFIDLEKVTTIKVPRYKVDNWNNGIPIGGLTEYRPVTIYQSKVTENNESKVQTPYLFIADDEMFNTDINNTTSGNCYAKNKFGVDENLRFAYFSKCVYELAKHLKDKENNAEALPLDIKAPNVVIMNDWHVGPLAPLMKYLPIIEAQKDNMSEETAKYFKETPSIYIAHNLNYQGAMYENDETLRTNVLGTLFGENSRLIVQNAHNRDDLPQEDRNALFKFFALNPGMMGVSLADRIAPVSQNYSEELLASAELGCGLQNILKLRDQSETLTPITNGLTKSTVIPSQKNLDTWMEDVKTALAYKRTSGNKVETDDIKLIEYTPINVKDGKAENKKQMFKLLNRIIDRERNEFYSQYDSLANLETEQKYVMYKPKETWLGDIEDPTKVPVMTFVGRVADQKGIDTIFKEAYLNFAREFNSNPKYKNWEVPVVIVGGPASESSTYKALEDFKNELRAIDKRFSDRFVLFKGFANTNLLSMASDFFLIPSKFEPCGLVQMEVMPKGVLPIATATGGLVSTITDQKNGFLSTAFYDGKDNGYSNTGKIMYVGTESRDIPTTNWQGYQDAMDRALHTFFKLPNKMEKMQKTAMNKDFSWDASSGPLEQYMKLIKEGKFEKSKTSYFTMDDEQDNIAYQ